MKYLQVLIILFFSISGFTQTLECEDLLKQYAVKPSKTIFTNCNTGTGQVILEANYKIAKADSDEVEKFLIQKYGMGKLKFTCCGWEPSNKGYFESKKLKSINKDYTLEVSMFGMAEKKDENGKIEIELDKSNVDFNLKVRILEI